MIDYALIQIRHYERGSQLWKDGLAYQHWRLMWQMGYKNCNCHNCVRAEVVWAEAHAHKWLVKGGQDGTK